MTATASPRASWDMARPHNHPSHRQSLKNSTTPLAYSPRVPPSVGQPMPPPNPYLNVRSSATQQDGRSSSPNYFGFVVDSNNTVPNSDEAAQMKRNWAQSPGSIRSAAATSPKVLPVESNSEFEAFRRQSETNSFNLNHGGLTNFSLSASKRVADTTQTPSGANSREGRPRSPRSSNHPTARDESTDPMDIDETSQPTDYISAGILGPSNVQQESPADFRSDVNTSQQRNQLSHVDDRHPRLSLPTNRLDPPSPGHFLSSHGHRAATLPVELNAANPSLIPSSTLAELLKSSSQDVLLLDLRPASKFGEGRIKDAINICLSTMLLKRTSFTADRLAEGLSNQQHRERFNTWRKIEYIVVYDDRSSRIQEAASLVTLLKKFPSDARKGRTLILQGGFAGFVGKYPELVDRGSTGGPSKISPQELSLESSSDTRSAVAGGCAMPATANAANPFFGNIRQNQDLRAGVGQINVKKPSNLKKPNECRLPKWLRGVIDTTDEGKKVSDNFLHIEQTEQSRMQKALSGKVCYGSPSDASQTSVQIAGIEKGSKNRYNNIWPFDHTRVRLQSVGAGGCDYINASHVKAPWSQRRYIATQGPVPATFEDFWKLIWEQDVRVIVMLTAESEGGQLKCHRYWDGSSFGQFKLALRDEHRVHLDRTKKSTRPPPPSRRKTTPTTPRSSSAPNSSSLPESKQASSDEEPAYVIVRRFSLRHTARPFVPMREITQLCYSSWPDFGAPAHPQHLLGLVEQCDKVSRATTVTSPTGASIAQRPVLVHCSAGCGRTGTFCTVDSVMEMLKRKRDAMKGKAEVEEWMQNDEIDLIEHTVKAFREQRISMVQNLGQYVLAYETILEWCSGVIEAETASGPKTPKTG